MNPPGDHNTWLSLWRAALLQPQVGTLAGWLQPGRVGLGRALGWLGWASLGSLLASGVHAWLLWGWLLGRLGPQARAGLAGAADGRAAWWFIGGYALLGALGPWLLLLLSLALQHPAARLLGRRDGGAHQLLTLLAGYTAPLVWLSLLGGLLPGLGSLVGLALGLYAFYLNVLAVQVVYRFSAGRAALVVIVPTAGLTLALGAAAVAAALVYAEPLRQWILALPGLWFGGG